MPPETGGGTPALGQAPSPAPHPHPHPQHPAAAPPSSRAVWGGKSASAWDPLHPPASWGGRARECTVWGVGVGGGGCRGPEHRRRQQPCPMATPTHAGGFGDCEGDSVWPSWRARPAPQRGLSGCSRRSESAASQRLSGGLLSGTRGQHLGDRGEPSLTADRGLRASEEAVWWTGPIPGPTATTLPAPKDARGPVPEPQLQEAPELLEGGEFGIPTGQRTGLTGAPARPPSGELWPWQGQQRLRGALTVPGALGVPRLSGARSPLQPVPAHSAGPPAGHLQSAGAGTGPGRCEAREADLPRPERGSAVLRRSCRTAAARASELGGWEGG